LHARDRFGEMPVIPMTGNGTAENRQKGGAREDLDDALTSHDQLGDRQEIAITETD
jgi:hypothetical protein